MEKLLSRDNKALFSFAVILYAMQRLKVMQNTTDGREFFYVCLKEYFELLQDLPVCFSYIFGFQLVWSKMWWALLQKFGNHWMGLLQFLYAVRALCQTPVQICFPHWIGYYSSYAVDGHKCVKLKLTQPIWHELVFLWLQTITIHSDSDCQNSHWQVH